MQQTLLWLKTWTAVWVLIALAALIIAGIILRMLVRSAALHPTHAVRVIESISIVAGGAVGSFLVLVLLIILWPTGGNWVINTFLSDTLIWQTEFQQWITRQIDDPTTSSAIGLLIQRIQFGSAFLGFLSGWFSKWLLEKLMGKGFHVKARIASANLQSAGRGSPRAK
jgi:ABC-type microcin C transport system permease subunit YejB